MMGFSAAGFFDTLANKPLVFKFKLPLAYLTAENQSDEITLFLYRYQTEETRASLSTYQDLPEEHRSDPSALNKVVREAVCGLMMKEPLGLDDFPADERPLRTRALQYFSVIEAANSEAKLLQEFYDSILLTVWNAHKQSGAVTSCSLLPFDHDQSK